MKLDLGFIRIEIHLSDKEQEEYHYTEDLWYHLGEMSKEGNTEEIERMSEDLMHIHKNG